jgi:hypothetical protein
VLLTDKYFIFFQGQFIIFYYIIRPGLDVMITISSGSTRRPTTYIATNINRNQLMKLNNQLFNDTTSL